MTKTKKTKAVPQVQKYAGCVIVQRHDGVDVCDPVTGKWQVFPSIRAARWSATVYTRLSQAFGRNTAPDTLLDYFAATAASTAANAATANAATTTKG